MDLTSKRVTVMGLGRFGGGLGVTQWLCAQGADVLVTDMEPADKLADSVAKIQPLVDKGLVRLRLGEHNVADFTGTDLVIANAAVPKPWDNRFLRAAEAARVPVTTEISLFISRLPPLTHIRTVGITGSVGKSTTTAMVHHALTAAGARRVRRVLMGGNIGISLLDELPNIDAHTYLILELSSAMLYWLNRTLTPPHAWSPGVGIITNISPNHIDWHGSFEHYRDSKLRLLAHQSNNDTAIIGAAVPTPSQIPGRRVIAIDAADFPSHIHLSVPGAHNRENAAAALAACTAVMPDVPTGEFAAAIASFGGLIHRLQLCAEGHGLRFYNDSKSTTPEACLTAVHALAEMPGCGMRNIHLIAGGYDKGSDLSSIGALAGELGGLYTIGKTGPAIADAAHGRAHSCTTLDAAFSQAMKHMHPGDCLLLSPGCASWDQFINYEQRGDAFIRLANARVSAAEAVHA